MNNRFFQLLDKESSNLSEPYSGGIDAVPDFIRPNLTFSSPELAPVRDLPNLSLPFSTALIELSKAHGSRHTTRVTLDHMAKGFCRFLAENDKKNLQLSEIDTTFINSYISHLTANGYSVDVKRHQLSALRKVMAWLTHSKWKSELRFDLRIQNNPWPAEHRHKKPPKAAHRDALLSIYVAAAKRCSETMGRISPVLNELESPSEEFLESEDRPLLECLRRLEQNIQVAMAGRSALEEAGLVAPGFAKNYGGITALITYLFPTPALLVPFVTLMTIHTRYNPSVIMGSQISDYSTESVLGHEMFKAAAYKARAKRKQVVFLPIEPTPDNPKSIYDFLVKWTSRIRPFAPAIDQGTLFIFLTEKHGRSIKGFRNGTDGTPSSDITWSHNYKKFCTNNNVPYVPLRELRLATLDLAHDISGGDLRMVQAIANHRSVQTTNDHYKSDAARERQFERLAEIMDARSRWVRTEGKIDVRGTPSDGDIGAATPGWKCLDPYSSPFWSKDSLCSAYGYCPICPLAAINFGSAYCCAQSHNLLDAVRRARAVLAPEAWLARMAPIQDALLTRWLPAFPEDVSTAAAQIVLPPLPTPE